ncbi:MAG: NAD(P)-dependent oxidoreductase, partial [Verrucomicrobia bacterium]|nr:NAD(P)-dependent oxidoreductase [Verrucomicrobiota bacterium]
MPDETVNEDHYISARCQSAAKPLRLKRERILVTGGSGFIGTNLIAFYLAAGAEAILNIDIAVPRNSAHNHIWAKVDLRDPEGLRNALHAFRPTAVFHLGARTDLDGKTLQEYSANTDGVTNLISALRELPAQPPTIFASSRLVYEIGHTPKDPQDYRPTTVYGESKAVGEQRVRSEAHNLPWIMVRPTSIWGPWFDTPYRDFFETVRSGYYMHPRGRRILKSYGFVGNSVFALDRLMFAQFESARSKMLYLCDYHPLEVRTWADLIANHLQGRRSPNIPVAVLKFAAHLGDVAKRAGIRNPPLTQFRLRNLLTEMIYDTEELHSLTGPLPFSLEDSVIITCAWIKKHG